jgi:hypothetical protein
MARRVVASCVGLEHYDTSSSEVSWPGRRPRWPVRHAFTSTKAAAETLLLDFATPHSLSHPAVLLRFDMRND